MSSSQTPAPAGLQDRSRLRSFARRSITVPAVFGLASLLAVTIPLWVPVLGVVDAFRRRRLASLRTGAFALAFLTSESLGLLGAAAIWLRDRLGGHDLERYHEQNFRLQCWWVRAHLACAHTIFGLEIDVDADADFGRGPVIVLMRHASIADTLLGAVLFSLPHRVRLRYVLKQELLWDPCLDVVGNRLPNIFVSRDGSDTAKEIGAVAQLTDDLGERDGVIIYPEGTRFTPEKRERILDRLREQGHEALLARAEKLEFTLPPRPGGTLALLETAPDVDVAVVSHVGFEGASSFSDIWSGRIIDARVRVRGRRIRAEEIPEDRRRWLFDQWEAIDAWVAQHGDSRT